MDFRCFCLLSGATSAPVNPVGAAYLRLPYTSSAATHVASRKLPECSSLSRLRGADALLTFLHPSHPPFVQHMPAFACRCLPHI